MNRNLICLALMAGTALIPQAPALAAESYENCTGFINSVPATITTQGTWCLDRDLSTAIASGNAITVATNNVIIDCNDFKLGGLAAGPATTAYGIRSDARLNTTVRNCNIRGFYYGTAMGPGGGGHLIERNRFDGNTYFSIQVESPGSTVRGNLVVDTGGSTNLSSATFAIFVRGGTDVIDNTVDGVAPEAENSFAVGIYSGGPGDGNVIGNRVRGLVPSGTLSAVGINVDTSGRTVVRDNTIQGPGAGTGTGIFCTSNRLTAQNNVIAGFPTGVTTCLSASNTVNQN